MKALTIILETIECGVTGEMGLAPQGANVGADDYMADTDGTLLAHDLLEHQNGADKIGGIGDELEALGAIWFGRGQNCDLSRDGRGSMYSPEQNVGSDVSRMAREFIYKGFDRAIPENVETDQDCSLRYIISYGIREARKEAEYEGDEQQGDRASMREYAANCLAFMQAGYIKAEAKYGTPGELCHVFWNVRDAVKPYAENAEIEGQQFELCIDADGNARCFEHYEDDGELGCDECGDWFAADSGEHVNQNGHTWCADCWATEQAA